MYRPNRIGPYPTVDLDRTESGWSGDWNPNLDSADHSRTAAPHLHVRSATVREDYDQATWIATAQSSLADNMAFGLGAAINGQAKSDGMGHLFCGHVSAVLCCSADQLGAARVVIGRAVNSALSVVRTDVGNELDSFTYLPANVQRDAHTLHVGWQGCVVQTDQDADGFGTNPILLGVQLVNLAGAAITFEYFAVSVTLQKYVEEIQIFDPVR